mmetsp:Transcript_28998/g.56697  ORF Transcript_28998/g.56697 Transcript_28998/m.56697 type:complete len:236 (+) Transcript_28998:719-1426(+)
MKQVAIRLIDPQPISVHSGLLVQPAAAGRDGLTRPPLAEPGHYCRWGLLREALHDDVKSLLRTCHVAHNHFRHLPRHVSDASRYHSRLLPPGGGEYALCVRLLGVEIMAVPHQDKKPRRLRLWLPLLGRPAVPVPVVDLQLADVHNRVGIFLLALRLDNRGSVFSAHIPTSLLPLLLAIPLARLSRTSRRRRRRLANLRGRNVGLLLDDGGRGRDLLLGEDEERGYTGSTSCDSS